MAFAIYEMKLVLAIMVTRLRLRLARPGPVAIVRRTITLAPEHGTRVVLESRERDAGHP